MHFPQNLVWDFAKCASKQIRYDAQADAPDGTKESPFVKAVWGSAAPEPMLCRNQHGKNRNPLDAVKTRVIQSVRRNLKPNWP